MITSHSLVHADFASGWYSRWAQELRQDKRHLDGFALHSNKFWQNAVMAEILWERGMLKKGRRALGFGVGNERLPALFARYGVRVMATDQDFRTIKAGHWAAHELATDVFSLNRLGVCEPQKFEQQVDYMPADMTVVPTELHDNYDFLWSNCALGHLGSIPAGLDFITQSLKCLRAGGWAVHTTELNILSDTETVTSGSTVVFRLRDIYNLSKLLTNKGYTIEPFILDLGTSEKDSRVSMQPQFGNDFSKIQIMGHLGTQIVLIIHNPKHPLTRLQQAYQLAKHARAYARNKRTVARYKQADPTISAIIAAQSAPLESFHIVPDKTPLKVTISQNGTSTVHMAFSNESEVPIFGTYSRLVAHRPIVLATSGPQDRTSRFRASSWQSNNRVSSIMLQTGLPDQEPIGYVQPHTRFTMPLELSAQGVKPGTYKESFSLVQELAGWLSQTTVTVQITVK